MSKKQRGNSPKLPTYKDTGCELHPVCTTCPFLFCLREAYGGRRLYKQDMRNQVIQRMLKDGKSNKEIAEAFGSSLRTVSRWIKAIQDKEKNGTD